MTVPLGDLWFLATAGCQTNSVLSVYVLYYNSCLMLHMSWEDFPGFVALILALWERNSYLTSVTGGECNLLI